VEIKFNPNYNVNTIETTQNQRHLNLRKKEQQNKNVDAASPNETDSVDIELSKVNADATQTDIQTLKEADALIARLKEEMLNSSEEVKGVHKFNRERIYSLLVDIEV